MEATPGTTYHSIPANLPSRPEQDSVAVHQVRYSSGGWICRALSGSGAGGARASHAASAASRLTVKNRVFGRGTG
jgi:hypothetical protein